MHPNGGFPESAANQSSSCSLATFPSIGASQMRIIHHIIDSELRLSGGTVSLDDSIGTGGCDACQMN
jgi:hypothetical protein